MTKPIDREFNAPPEDGNGAMQLSIRSATVTAISGHVATITLGGAPVPGVLVYHNVSPLVGSVVEVLFVGKSPRIIGVTG